MPSISSAYRGPLIIMGLGGGFSVVGAVPVAITFSIGVKTSATVIGMGFVTFGFLLMLPGFFWCIMVRTHSFKVCWKCCRSKGKQHHMRHKSERRQKWGRRDDDEDLEEEETPALCYNQEGSQIGSPSRSNDVSAQKWPPVYVDTPSLMITASENYKESCEDLQLRKLCSECSTPNRNSNNNNDHDGVSQRSDEMVASMTEPSSVPNEQFQEAPQSPSKSPSRPTNLKEASPPPSPSSPHRLQPKPNDDNPSADVAQIPSNSNNPLKDGF